MCNLFSSLVPGSPTSLTLHALSPTEINVTWEAPVEKNGEIIRYKLKFLKSAENDRDTNENIIEIDNVMHKGFSGLEPYTEYNASVQASTKVGDGSWTRIVREKTQAIGTFIQIFFYYLPQSYISFWTPTLSKGSYKIALVCLSVCLSVTRSQ